MNDEIYSDVTIERTIEAAFGLKLSVNEVVAREIPVAVAATATLFKTSPNTLYCFIQSQSNLVLADVRKMLRNMNVEAESYIPPHGDKDYFQRIGTEKFKAMFPGKYIMSDEDTRYYKTLAPYNPALVRISRVKGDIRAFHIETRSWRKVKDYAFSRITL
jgi:hypothetical protein